MVFFSAWEGKFIGDVLISFLGVSKGFFKGIWFVLQEVKSFSYESCVGVKEKEKS